MFDNAGNATVSVRRPLKCRSAGLSLTELLVAMVLSMAVIGTVISVFAATKRSYLVQDNVAWMQENARHAFRRLGYDIRMSGYLGELQAYWNLAQTAILARQLGVIPNECFTQTDTGATFRWVAPMLANDGAALPTFGPKISGENNSGAMFDCLTAGTAQYDYRAGTDVISLHYAESAAVADAALTAGRVYISTTLSNGILFQCNGGGGVGCSPGDVPAVDANHPIYAGTYYVTPCGREGNDAVCATSDDVPALMRVRLEADGTIGRDRVAEGVIDMQIQYGIDLDADGLADSFIDSTNTFLTVGSWQGMSTVKVVRIWLLMRVREPGYSDPNGNYVYGDANVAPVAGYRYQLYSSTFAVRNQYSPAAF